MVSLRAKRGNLNLNGVIASEAWQSQPEWCHCERSVAISTFH